VTNAATRRYRVCTAVRIEAKGTVPTAAIESGAEMMFDLLDRYPGDD
jgi:hypothetical protein